MCACRTKDGRWYVKQRKGRDQERPHSTSRYFGRGEDAYRKAEEFRLSLVNKRGNISPSLLEKTHKKEAELCKEIEAIRSALAKTTGSMESSIRDALSVSLVLKGETGVITEHKTPAGFVDIITDNYLIEIKYDLEWKVGIGQLSAYKCFIEDKTPILYLFKKEHRKNGRSITDIGMRSVVSAAQMIGVRVVVHNCEDFVRLCNSGIYVGYGCHFDAAEQFLGKKSSIKNIYKNIKLLRRGDSSLRDAGVGGSNPLVPTISEG